MNIRNLLIGAAFAGVLGCTGANGQVLGGGLGGALGGGAGGAMSGGLNDLGVTGRGSIGGSLGGHFDAEPLERASRKTTQRAVGHGRETIRGVRNRAASASHEARNVTSNAAVDASAFADATVATTADPQRVAGAAQVASSSASSAAAEAATSTGAVRAASEAAAAPAAAVNSETQPGETSALRLGKAAAGAGGAAAGDASVSSDGARANSSMAVGASVDASR